MFIAEGLTLSEKTTEPWKYVRAFSHEPLEIYHPACGACLEHNAAPMRLKKKKEQKVKKKMVFFGRHHIGLMRSVPPSWAFVLMQNVQRHRKFSQIPRAAITGPCACFPGLLSRASAQLGFAP